MGPSRTRDPTARMTSGMPRGLESQRVTQPATPTPSKHALLVVNGCTYRAGTQVHGGRVGYMAGIGTPYKPCGTLYSAFLNF